MLNTTLSTIANELSFKKRIVYSINRDIRGGHIELIMITI